MHEHPKNQMDEPLKELMKDPGPREEGQYVASHGANRENSLEPSFL